MLVKGTSATDAATDKALAELRAEINGRGFTAGARVLESVQLVNTRVNRIAHGLGRRVEGFVVVRERSVVDLITLPSGVMHPSNDANWTKPTSGNDYWTITAGAGSARHINVPLLGLHQGMKLTKVGVEFQRAAAVDNAYVLRSSKLAATTSHTPTVAWTTPSGSGVWARLEATYDIDIGDATYQLIVAPQNNGDLLRSAFMTVENVPLCLIDKTARYTDGDKFLYLQTSNLSAEVDLVVF